MPSEESLMYDVTTLTMELSPTYRISRSPTAPRMGGTSTSRAGTIGITLSEANDGSVGGVVNGRENSAGRCPTPRSVPSARDMTANPNMMFAKNAPKSSTLVACHTANCAPDSLYSEKLWTVRDRGSCCCCCCCFCGCGPLPMNPISVVITYQKTEERAAPLTRTSAMAERTRAETVE